MAINTGNPMAPQPSAAIQTGYYANPANRGKRPEEITATLPRFTSWDEALRHPSIASLGSDEARTNYLRDVYGLSGELKVENGQVVNRRGFLARNAWWLAPAAMVGASAAPAVLGGGGTGAAGAVANTASAAQAAAAGAWAAGAAGTGAGAGMGLMNWLDPIMRYGVEPVGNLVAGRMQIGANDRATQAQMDYYNRALAAAEEEQRYRRAFDEERRAYDRSILDRDRADALEQRDFTRGQLASYQSRLEPFAAPGRAALGRMESMANSGMRLQGPDGSMRTVMDPQQAAYFVSKGARRVG